MPSTSSASEASTSKAGIITNENGERHIPSSTRADGSQRKEIRIRPGYRPPEDVEVYKNRTAAAWKSRGSGGVPGADGLKNDESTSAKSASTNKNAKRREARKKAKAAGDDDNETTTTTNEGALSENLSQKENWRAEAPTDVTAEKEKQARKLKKKLREARELQEKKDKGEALLHEQFEKVIRINELIRDLDRLGFDANGEPKGDNAALEAEKEDKTE